ncbi:MAG: hypothetical protein QXT43_00895 [Candidatus Micrarchaeaceae archaeon]
MRTEKPAGSYLMSGMHVRINMRKPLAYADSLIAKYPGFVLIGKGSKLDYMLAPESENPDHFYTVSITKDEITLLIFSKASPLYFFSEAVLRLVNVLQFLASVCTADLSSIYSYIVMALAQRQLSFAVSHASQNVQHAEQDALSALLSARVKQLLAENFELKRKEAESGLFARRALALLVVSCFGGVSSVSEVAAKTGFGVQAIREAISYMPSIGYRAVFRGSDRFELVGV